MSYHHPFRAALQELREQAREQDELRLSIGAALFLSVLITGICLSVIVSPDWQLAWSAM